MAGWDLECIDRIYLNGGVPTLQVPGQVVSFLTRRLGFPIPSPSILERIGLRFRKTVTDFAAEGNIPVIRFAKGQRNLEVMRLHLDRLIREGRAGVAAIRSSNGCSPAPRITVMRVVAEFRGSVTSRPTAE